MTGSKGKEKERGEGGREAGRQTVTAGRQTVAAGRQTVTMFTFRSPYLVNDMDI